MSWRYKFSLFAFFVLFFLVTARLFYWQVVRASELQSIAQSQYGRNILLPAERGEIKTSDDYSVVANKLSYLVFANPKEVEDKSELSDALAPILKTESSTISAQLKLDRFWVPIKNHIDHKAKEKIESLKFKGVGFEKQSSRFYPEASMSAKLFGFVGKDDNGSDKGYFGLEGFYDRQLRGKSTHAVVIHDAAGRPILSKLEGKTGQSDGRSLTLNINRSIQFMLDETLKDGVERYGATGGMAAIMDPKTGAMIAMSSFPTFDPKEYQEYSDKLYRDPLISDTYEPGSTFKPLVMAAGLDAGLIKPDTKCPICSGPVEIGGYEIRTWNNKYVTQGTMTDVIKRSDNTGMVYIGQSLGLDRMMSYINKFGFGEQTGIDLQGEVVPSIRPRDSWYPIDLATSSFGQGITVTPIQLLTAFSAIANNGNRMEPHVVSKITTVDGESIEIKPKLLGKPVSERTAHVVTEMMVNAVDNGESKFAKPKGYRIAGKTGTAQIPVEGHYDANKTIASFIGFAPADDPKFLMLVVIDRPTTSIYGAETAAPIFFTAAKNMFTYYGIPPSE
ncbi:MAG TPA: penicillin-binding protein 2 [Candidatus Limnocylindrales bacterium]|nr:penicillin-binding protein 2 [Candidatus Limnocylindrales bacterium]